MTAADSHSERYELIDRIAVGGMAEVYRAKVFGAHGFAKTMAIKRILPELVADPEFERRFISEAKLAVELSHANVVQVFDFGRFAGSLFIAMEFVDGLDLAALLKWHTNYGRLLPLPAALQIAIDICRGLDYAHKHGVVHRDVSPSNILVSQAGEVKVADFGIAEASSKAASGTRKIMGKWRYMSPEQTRGERLSTRSDIFSLGALMYELFTGSKLFPGSEPQEIASNIESMPVPAASSVRSDLPKRIDELLGSTLARSPDDRCADAASIQRSLTEICYESAILATPLDVAELVTEVVIEVTDRSTEARKRGQAGVDELIRAQLLGGLAGMSGVHKTAVQPVERKTAVEEERHTEVEEDEGELGPAIVSRRTGRDGITVWELDNETIAAAPAAIRDGRRRTSRGTDVSVSAENVASRAKRIKILKAAGVFVFLVMTTLFVWRLQRGGGGAVPTDASALATRITDARAIAAGQETRLIIDSEPSGARVAVDGERLDRLTPTTISVNPETPSHIELELEGYERWEDRRVRVPDGELLRIRPRLVQLVASLSVKTRPVGAVVRLDGDVLGETPLLREDLSPGKQVLRISKPGFRTVEVNIALSSSSPILIEKVLRSAVEMGSINLHIDGGWADVYLGGKKVGRAPVRGLKLPIGRHRLRLYNPKSRKEKMLSVEVDAQTARYYRTTL